MIADVIRRLAVRDLPQNLALVKIDGADGRIGRLRQRQALHRDPGASALAAASSRARGSGSRAARDVGHVRLSRRGRHQPERTRDALRGDIGDVGFRIVGSARPIGAAAIGRHHQRAERTVRLAHHRRREDRPQLIFRRNLQRLRP